MFYIIEKIQKMNGNPKDNEKNMDRKSNLKDYTSKFKEIKEETNKIIESNKYDAIDFYGIILSYLNYYDYDNFSKIVEELFTKNLMIYMKFCLFIILISNIQLI